MSEQFLYTDNEGMYTEGIIEGNSLQRTCDAGAVVGDFVVQGFLNANSVDVVTSNIDKRTVIGIIVEKPTVTDAIVMTKGVISGLAGMIKSQKVYLGADGKISPAIPLSGYLQVLGHAIDEDKVDFYPINTKIKLHVEIDGNDEHTVLMVHSNTFDGDDVFIDSSASGHILSPVNGAVHSDAEHVFGSSSIQCDDTLNSNVSVPNSDDFNFGSDDFTVDFWYKPMNTSVRQPILSNGYNNGWIFEIQSNKLVFYWATSGGYIYLLDPTILLNNTWYHVAGVKNGNSMTLYVNGVNVETKLAEPVDDSEYDLFIGGRPIYSNAALTGYIDEVRISKGIARWTENFTPPSYAYIP